MKLQAITLHQPWASLICYGYKPWEFRPWCAPRPFQHTRIAIHAGKRPMDVVEARQIAEFPRNFEIDVRATSLLEQFIADAGIVPYGAVLCTVFLGRPRRCSEQWPDDPDIDPRMWAWPVSNVEPINPPVPATGKQGFWQWEMPRDA